jgi:hypothetical protein
MTSSEFIKKHYDHESHLNNVGTLIEDMENNLRNVIEEIYLKKSKEV